MLDPKYIHLNVHSDYSIIDGLCKIDNILKKTYEYNMPSIALTDFSNLSASIKFFKKSFYYGIKPIIGLDICIYFKDINNLNFSTLLVTNSIGYKNLIKLVSFCYKNNKSYIWPCIDYRILLKYNDGLIILFSINYYCNISNKFFSYNNYFIKKHIFIFKKFFFDRFYLQIFRLGHKYQNKYVKDIINLSLNYNIQLVATNKILFLYKKDFFLNKIRSCIYYGCNLKKILNYIDYTNEYYYKNEDEMCKLFFDIPDALLNTVKISKLCNFFIKKKSIFLPKYPYCGISSYNYLKKIVFKNFRNNLLYKISFSKKKIYFFRIKKELNIILKLKISDYFLIVMDFINWSKKNNIYVGPGRGSGAGSLVAFLLNITIIDPIKYDLIFERFLNIERKSMPDFDIDFCINKRDDVISYIENLYGKKSVAQIVTFSTMTSKSVLRDVGRVLGYSYSFVDYLAKLIPFDNNITLKKAIILESKLNTLYKNNDEIKYLINVSSKLEGLIKGISKHAGGIVITPNYINNYCATFYDKESNKLVTQFDKSDIEYIGLVKFDLLGLKTLTIINNTINLINKKNNLKKKIDINNISLKNKLCFFLLKKCRTTSVFQLESRGIKDLIKRLKPNCFSDIIDLLALYRPGPLQSGMVDNFIKRKNYKENIYYPDKKLQHKLLIPILKCTYGIILYQEQVMKIAQVLAGYSLGEADSLRMAISKKNIKNMNFHEEKFCSGCSKLGINYKLSFKIFSLMKNFASYGFNKSHSVAYAFLAYQTLWLKSNYTSEFLVSFINNYIDNIDKVNLIIYEIKNFGIKIIPPNINTSSYYFDVISSKEILYGLGAIKGIGKNSILNIINIRNKYGKFKNFVDFCFLVYSKKLTKLVLKKLIFSGSLDIFKINRLILINFVDRILKLMRYKKIFNLNFKQLNLFKYKNYDNFLINKEINNYKFISDKKKFLYKEKEVLGLYLSNHPISEYINEIKKYKNFIYINKLYFLKNIKNIIICGIINSVKFLSTKKNNRICLINLEDTTSSIDLLIFRDIYIKYSDILEKNNLIILFCRIFYSNIKYNNNIIVNKIKLL